MGVGVSVVCRPFKIFHNNPDLFQAEGTHYHHNMRPGENTLHSRVQEVAMQSIVEANKKKKQTGTEEQSSDSMPVYDHQDYCRRFVSFMTTPGAHPDTYIGGAMRLFFSRLAADPGGGFADK